MSAAEISDDDFRALRDAIRERFGIDYDDSKQYLLQSRLQARLIKRSVPDFGAYSRFLSSHRDREDEWNELASLLTNNETYFFRERAQLDILVGPVLEESLRARGHLRVWSAACSTGEEPYTLAMMLLESHRVARGQISVLASDLSPRALDRGAAGFYRELSFRACPPEIVQRYFRPSESGFELSDEVKRLVTFSRLNLLDSPGVAAVGPVDAIFCRNLLIYFDKPTQKRVVENLARALRPGGYLFLGHAESIARLTDLYEPIVTAQAIYYRVKPR